MQTWEQEVAEFEMKYAKKVDEDAKILALKSIMPETLFGGAGRVQRKIVQPQCGLAHSHHQRLGC